MSGLVCHCCVPLQYCQAPCHVVFYTNKKEPNNTYCFHRSLCDLLFNVLFLSTCFKSVSDIRGIPLWLCNMIWGEWDRERKRGRGLSCWVSCPTVRSYFSACFTVVGSWLIVGLLGSFRHAWPRLISLVYCKPPLITLHTIKANILITACLIINSHWENEWFDLTSVIIHMWLRNKQENKTTCLFGIFYRKKNYKPVGLSDFLILTIDQIT